MLPAACKKEVKNTLPGEFAEKYIVLGNTVDGTKMVRLENPKPKVDTIHSSYPNDTSYIVIENYGFDFYSRFDALQIQRSYGYTINTAHQRQYHNSISISCNMAMVDSYNEKLTKSRSTNSDSLLNISEHSPLTNLDSVENPRVYTNNYPAAFSEGDTFYVSDAASALTNSNEIQVNARNLITLHYHYQEMTYYYNTTDSIYNYQLFDFYYPKWKGIEEKYVVFSASLGEPIPKLGWIKLSVGLNGELTVHEVAYQVD